MRCFVRGIFKIVLSDFYYPIIYFSICLDFSHICSRHLGVIFFKIFIFIYGFLILFQLLKIWSLVGLLFVVNDNKKNYISFLQYSIICYVVLFKF